MSDQLDAKPRRRGIYLLPNLFTTAALFAGFYAIVAAMSGRFSEASMAILWPWCWTEQTAVLPA